MGLTSFGVIGRLRLRHWLASFASFGSLRSRHWCLRHVIGPLRGCQLRPTAASLGRFASVIRAYGTSLDEGKPLTENGMARMYLGHQYPSDGRAAA